MKAVHFGAGNIGRGFVAEFLHKSGYEIVFCDVIDTVIDTLNSNKCYKVIQVGVEGKKETEITNYRAINTKISEGEAIEEIRTADIVTCSVGPRILQFIAPLIAKGIDQRSNDAVPVAIVACENAIGATDTLAKFIRMPENMNQDRLCDLNKRARFANSAIDRIVPRQDPDAGLNVKLEEFYEWIIDETPFLDCKIPMIIGVKWVCNLTPYIERKLFTVNTGHAAAAYYGHYYKKKTILEAMQTQVIQDEVRKVLAETSKLIINKHSINEEEQKEYVQKILVRIQNPYLEDSVERVGRAPMRKLSRNERFIAPAVELARDGQPFTALLDAAEKAFRFQDVEDSESRELTKILKTMSAPDVVHKVCGLDSDEKLFPYVVEIVRKVQDDTS